MTAPGVGAPGPALLRVRQVFQFLKAFAERNTPLKRTLGDQEWSLPLRELPAHPAVTVGEVRLDDAGSETSVGDDDVLLRIRRPEVTEPPQPPHELLEWLELGWHDPADGIRVRPSRNVVRAGETQTEAFADAPGRSAALANWRARWDAWAQAERPAREAMALFERLYALRQHIQLESERVELLLGDGRLRWQRSAGAVDHPVLLQRVELVFDAQAPEFRVVDADRAPELYGALLQDGDNLSAAALAQLRSDLEARGYHPLAGEPTAQFLQRLAQLLGPRGSFLPQWSERAAGPDPVIMRDPVLFLRQRIAGYAAAFDRVLEDLEGSPVLPPALVRLVGVEPPPAGAAEIGEYSPWGEPPDVLLSKPANAEQVQIARAIETHRAVLVQGPPGTGKSHTIANLIGHLVAQGKRVLVTSHTTKALGVLRGHLVESLRPLCVAVLDNDLDGRTQMEQAVRQILARFTTSSSPALEREVAQLASSRDSLNQQISAVTTDLRAVREAEYEPIQLGGQGMAPTEAARWVKAHEEGNAWIPGPIQQGAPLPLSVEQLHTLYATNGQLTPNEETELKGGLPHLGDIAAAQQFAELVAALDAVEPEENAHYWMAEPSEAAIGQVQELVTASDEAIRGLGLLAAWERTLVAAGHGGGTEIDLWRDLAKSIRAAHDEHDRARPAILEYAPELPQGWQPDDTRRVLSEIIAHMQGGGSLGMMAFLLHGKWKPFIGAARVNGTSPSHLEHFRALRTQLGIEEARRRLAVRWARQAEPIGLPSFASCGITPEAALVEYASQFDRLLGWWERHWGAVETAATQAGLIWRNLRARHVAAGGPAVPFERDVSVLAGPLHEVATARLGVARRKRAERALWDLEVLLGSHRGPACSALHFLVVSRDSEEYPTARARLERLAAKAAIWEERKQLLDTLRGAARGWVRALSGRSGEHGAAALPGDPEAAWRWRQFRQEIDRRAALDERALNARLEQLRRELREVTANLIDRKAWLEQIRRTGLEARQALQGWADTQRRIGRGTGRRAPELRIQARKQLETARDAVPVWIMPLARVAESFDPARPRFDVVIVDEASQSDVTGLLAWYLGDRIAVVGDHEQVSPLAVGQQIETMTRFIAEHLAGIPNAHLYDGQTSIYNLARQCFGGTIALREHFRCVPDIIAFSNHLSYNGEIRPLRNPAPVARPHVVECMASPRLGNGRVGRTNLAEARTVVALLRAMADMREYQGRTVGAIALLGDEQAGLIQDLAVRHVGAVQLEGRRFVAGNPAQFQGDERDVMFLSMVDVPTAGPLAMRQTELFKQRYNVAASRAKDQLWLVHSLDPGRDLQPGDLRRALIDHVRDPGARARQIQERAAQAESPFERAVIERLVGLGFRVEPQVWVGRYRLDMVVSSNGQQVAIECDGDRFHGMDKIPEDMARQAVLERAGWRFIRVRGTRFYRAPEETTGWIVDELRHLGVAPMHDGGEIVPAVPVGGDLREEVIRRAWEFIREWGWAPEVIPGSAVGGSNNGDH